MDAHGAITVLPVMIDNELEETTIVDPPRFEQRTASVVPSCRRAKRDTLPYYFPPRRVVLTTTTWGD